VASKDEHWLFERNFELH